eukprot:6005432-Pyramimonas_sp.AAC.1
MVFSAKGDHPTNATAVPVRKPSSTRPLSMGCADGKLISAAIASPLTQVSTHSIVESQTGGVPGRSILENSIACE